MRTCCACKQTKELSEFYGDKRRPLGKEYVCKVCNKAKRQNHKMIQNYGIDKVQYLELLTKQDNKCAICGREDTGVARTQNLSIDHCHKSGVVRGLLCNWCNQGLGHFHDNPELLKKAAEYIVAKGSV